jgi:hypothetical protein
MLHPKRCPPPDHLRIDYFIFTLYLDVRCPPKAHMLKALFPAGGTIEK